MEFEPKHMSYNLDLNLDELVPAKKKNLTISCLINPKQRKHQRDFSFWDQKRTRPVMRKRNPTISCLMNPQTAKAPERFLFLGPILKRYASRHEKKVDLKGGHAHDQRHQDKKVSGETSKEIHITEAKIITSDPTFAART
jgi:hypothetical protein